MCPTCVQLPIAKALIGERLALAFKEREQCKDLISRNLKHVRDELKRAIIDKTKLSKDSSSTYNDHTHVILMCIDLTDYAILSHETDPQRGLFISIWQVCCQCVFVSTQIFANKAILCTFENDVIGPPLGSAKADFAYTIQQTPSGRLLAPDEMDATVLKRQCPHLC